VMNFGTVDTGGSGCVCPESVFLKALLSHVVLERSEVAIVDMEAGIEHLGRATATGVDRMIMVVEPGMRSVETAERIVRLAGEIGLKNLAAVANKVRSPEDVKYLEEKLGAIELIGSVSFRDEILRADMDGVPPYDACPALADEIAKIADRLGLS